MYQRVKPGHKNMVEGEEKREKQRSFLELTFLTCLKIIN